MIGRQVVKNTFISCCYVYTHAHVCSMHYMIQYFFFTMYSLNFISQVHLCKHSNMTQTSHIVAATSDLSSFAEQNYSSHIEIHSLINATPQTALVTPYARACSNLSLASHNYPGCYATQYRDKYDDISSSTLSSLSSVHLDSYDYDADVEYYEICEKDGEKKRL